MGWRVNKLGYPGTCSPAMQIVISDIVSCCFAPSFDDFTGKWVGTFNRTVNLSLRGCWWCYEAPSADLIYREFIDGDCENTAPENLVERIGRLVVTARFTSSTLMIVQVLAQEEASAPPPDFTDVLGEFEVVVTDCSVLEYEEDDLRTTDAHCGEALFTFLCDGTISTEIRFGYGGHIVISATPPPP